MTAEYEFLLHRVHGSFIGGSQWCMPISIDATVCISCSNGWYICTVMKFSNQEFYHQRWIATPSICHLIVLFREMIRVTRNSLWKNEIRFVRRCLVELLLKGECNARSYKWGGGLDKR